MSESKIEADLASPWVDLARNLLAAARIAMLLIVIALLAGQSSSARSTSDPSQATDPFELATLERIDQIPMGTMNAITQDGDRAYLGLGPRLAIVDLSNPSRPQITGISADFGDLVLDIAVDPSDGDRVVVAASSAGIWEADVSDPADPRARPLASVPSRALLVESDRILALGSALHILDRPPGSMPVVLGNIDEQIEGFDIDGDTLWLAAGAEGVLAYDLSDPARPRRVGTVDTPGHAYDIRLREQRGYVADGGRHLRILDLSDPLEPGWLADFAIDISDENDCETDDPDCGFDSRWIRIHHDRLLLGSAYRAPWLTQIEGRLTSLDLSDPLQPRPIDRTSFEGSISDISFGIHTLVSTRPVWYEDSAFYCRLVAGGLEVFDSSLERSGHVERPIGANHLALYQDRIYVAGRARWLWSADLDPPSLLVPGPWPSRSYGDSHNTEAGSVVVDARGPRIAFGLLLDSFDWLLDAQGPAQAPSKSKREARGAIQIDFEGPGDADRSALHGCSPSSGDALYRQLATDGHNDYALDHAGGLQVFGPDSSQALVRIEEASVFHLDARQGLIYLIEHDGLRILDSRDPTAPKDVGNFAILGYTRAIALAEQVGLAVLAGTSGISVIDVRRPELPIQLASIPTLGPVVDLAIEGHTVYLVSETGIQAFDLSDATRPVERARVEGLRGVRALAVDGTRVAVSHTGGISLYGAVSDDGRPPELPTPLHLPVLLGHTGIHGQTPSPSVILQVADKGGLPSPPYFQDDIRQTPWFTLYNDGSYIRYPQLDMHHPRTGSLTPDRLVAQIERFVGGGAFFDYPADDDIQRCQTDGSTTHVLLDWRGRRHRVRSYLMYWIGKNPQRCPPGSPSMPIGLETARFYALANEVAALNRPLAANEHDAKLESATVYMDGDAIQTNRPIHPWPLERPMQDSAGRDRLSADELHDLARAIRRLRPWADAPFAYFEDGNLHAAVGIRFEPPGWRTYCLGEAGCGW